MRHSATKKEPERYYLLPGMGGKAQRDKAIRMLGWGIVAGLATSLCIALFLYFVNRMGIGSM